MRLLYFTIPAHDIELLRYWYMRYFAMSSSDKTIIDNGRESYRLTCPDDDTSLLIVKDSESYPTVETAVSVASRQGVDFVTELLRTDGNLVEVEPSVDGYGLYRSIVLDPEGNRVTVTE
ncbi:MAG: hypothetical protein K2K84_02865 [Muribaculaceae bacterium]|nr:hypothetical protein [Muribaculaceae bacterium]